MPWCLDDTGMAGGLEAPSVEGLDVCVPGSSRPQSFLSDGPHHIPMVHKQLAQECSPLLNDPLQCMHERPHVAARVDATLGALSQQLCVT